MSIKTYLRGLILLGIILFSSALGYTQTEDGVGIGTASVDASAVLEVVSPSNNKGLLIPKLTNAQMNNIVSPATGLIIYNTDAEGLYHYVDGGWSMVGTPRGTITMWSGSTAPSGWAICNGTNGTPNLQGRFIVGYKPSDTDYDNPGSKSSGGTTNGDTGGSESVTLTTAQIPSHNHSISDDEHTHSLTITEGSNTISLRMNTSRTLEWLDDLPDGVNGPGLVRNNGIDMAASLGAFGVDYTSTYEDVDISSQTHTHSGTASADYHSHTIGNTGLGNAHENRPPYYTLAYIMKL